MTYEEFKKTIKAIDGSLQVEMFDDALVSVYTLDGRWVASIKQQLVGILFNNPNMFERWSTLKRLAVLDVLYKFAKTPIEEREVEVRYIVPLPKLVTTDGEQQYLTQKGEKFFACRRNKELRQTWKKEHLKYIPEEYREYAEILNED